MHNADSRSPDLAAARERLSRWLCEPLPHGISREELQRRNDVNRLLGDGDDSARLEMTEAEAEAIWQQAEQNPPPADAVRRVRDNVLRRLGMQFFTPVDQTTFGKGEGNCFAACLASLTGIPLDTLHAEIRACDEAHGDDHWYDRAQRVMARHGYTLEYETAEPFPGYCIASGTAERGLLHSCIALNGVVVHDPHPSRAGLLDITDWIAVRSVLPPAEERKP